MGRSVPVAVGPRAERGHDKFIDPDDDDQRRTARSPLVDLSAAADRLPESFRAAHPEVDWRGIRGVRFPAVAQALLGSLGVQPGQI